MAATTNPFDIKSGAVTGSQAPSSGILSSAMGNVAGPDTTKDVAQVDTSGVQGQTAPAGTATSTGYTADQAGSTGYDAAKMAGTNWDVTADQTVEGRTANLVNSDSLLNQRAQAQALQQANGLGLRNSSIAAGMGTAAVLDKSIQIATPDAATFAAAAKSNTDTANQVAANNQNASNTAAQFGANASNTASLQNAQLGSTAKQFGANADNTASSQNAAAANQLQSQKTGIIAQAAGQDAQSKNAAVSQTAQLGQQAALANQAQAYDAGKTQYTAALQTAMQNADSNTKALLANLDAQVKTNIETIDAQFKTQMQASQSSATMYSQTMASIGNILNNKDLTGDAMQSAINQQLNMLKSSLALQQGITSIPGLADLINGITAGPSTVSNPSNTGQWTTKPPEKIVTDPNGGTGEIA